MTGQVMLTGSAEDEDGAIKLRHKFRRQVAEATVARMIVARTIVARTIVDSGGPDAS